MNTGIVKRVETSGGFGYIKSDDGTEYYFHRAGVEPPLTFDNLFGGERVSFEIETNSGSQRAVEVTQYA